MTDTDARHLAFAESTVKQVTYKPGWTFRVEPAEWQGRGWLVLIAESKEPESRGDGARDQYRSFGIGSCRTAPEVIAWVRRAIQTWELHEADEFLRYGGELVHDPHNCPDCHVGNWLHHAVSQHSWWPRGRE